MSISAGCGAGPGPAARPLQLVRFERRHGV